MLRKEVGHPLPLGTHMSPPLRLLRRRTQLGQARPPHGRAEPLARRRLQGVLHFRQRNTSPRRRLSPKHGSRTKWRPGPPNQGDFASLSEPVLAQGGIVTPPANPGSPEYSPDLASESSQDKQESTRVLPPSLPALLRRSPLRRPPGSTGPAHRQAPALMVVSLQRPRARPRKASLLRS